MYNLIFVDENDPNESRLWNFSLNSTLLYCYRINIS